MDASARRTVGLFGFLIAAAASSCESSPTGPTSDAGLETGKPDVGSPPVDAALDVAVDSSPDAGGLCFAGKNRSVGTNPTFATSGDLNGDGTLDLIVTNQGNSDIAVLLGVGDGTFQAPKTYTTGPNINSNPGAPLLLDLNSDSKLDLVVVDADNFEIAVFLGNGDGTLQPANTYSTDTGPLGLTSGDFNGDNKVDLAVATYNNDVSVLLGNGDGSFQSPNNYGAGAVPIAVASGDFDGDGTLDLAVVNANDKNISILIGNGNGSFQSPKNYPLLSTPHSIVTADFDGDGSLDLAVAEFTDVAVLMGHGDGTFAALVPYAAGSSPNAITLDDFDGDTKVDIAVADAGGSNASILLGNGDGTFHDALVLPAAAASYGVTSGDFNKDGKRDLAVANFNGNNVTVLLQCP